MTSLGTAPKCSVMKEASLASTSDESLLEKRTTGSAVSDKVVASVSVSIPVVKLLVVSVREMLGDSVLVLRSVIDPVASEIAVSVVSALVSLMMKVAVSVVATLVLSLVVSGISNNLASERVMVALSNLELTIMEV